MKKICIFCGCGASEKTKEHVLPKWLIALTGSPNRKAYFGRDWLSPDLKERNYSWKAFTFPACNDCNNHWSKLESRIKIILDDMLNGKPLVAQDICLLLDWFDKVRTGLWLGMYYLNSNYRAIIPQFYINQRVGTKDRILIISESEEPDVGIGLLGCDTPIFHVSPSVCGITINHLHFISASADFLVSKKLGLPFLVNKQSIDINTDGFNADFAHGHQKIYSPIIDDIPECGSTVLFQPITAHAAIQQEFYSNEYTKNLFLDNEKGMGRILIGNTDPEIYPDTPTTAWQSAVKQPTALLLHLLGLWAAEEQKRLFLDVPSFSHFPEEDRKAREREINGIVKIHDLVLSHIRNGGI